MAFLSDADKKRVTDAIAAAERKTSGEFVAVVAERSDHYLFFPMLWTAIASLIVPGAMLLAGADLSLLIIYAIQLAGFIVAAVVFFQPSIRPHLAPGAFRHDYGHRFAHEQFYFQGVHRTRDHSGVLLFVSIAERYVEIVADEGIHRNVGEAHWQQIVDNFVSEVKARRVADGFVGAVTAIGDAMATHYPRQADDTNELSNRLIEV
ncbi:MAG TPA: TPM domain-containing protein [Gammaproteobacteria bacterium]|nr:TPM domain-containing protein [Gammaproteobacteria bacterium]